MILVALFVIGAVFSGGALFGYSKRPAIEKVYTLFNKEIQKPAQVDFSPFWEAWNRVESKYVDNDELDTQKMVWGAIQGMVASLDDPYSVFFPPEENELFQSSIRGDFEGVGMEIGIRNNILTVIAPLKDTPAFRAGIKAGDKILEIDGKSTVDITIDKAVRLIRGKKGTKVVLTILREGEEESREISIIRDVIQIPVLDTEQKSSGKLGEKHGDIFVIKLYNFSEKSPLAFRSALQEMINSDCNKLILDLRNNAGGYLEAATDIASWFLPSGKIVAREQFGNGDERLYRSRGYNIFKNLPFVIIVNEGSASASEILAGALQEYGIATLVGEKTFGKGSVQELFSITNDTALKLTVAKWLTPNGKSISKEGLTPDVVVKMTKEDIEQGRDPQMEKAIEILSKL